MARREWRKAQAILDGLPPETLATPDAQFVLAFLARRLGEGDKAIEIYQRLLDADPGLLRIRLELADTYFEMGEERAAQHNYRLALASDASAPVRAGIEQRLKTIAERRRWRYSVNVAVAPDSNVNAATDARELWILGLPFELSDEARRTSGISLSTVLSAERSVALQGRTRLVFGGWGRFVDNENRAFDDGAVGVRAGPQFWRGQTKLEARGLAERRWFGGRPLSKTGGAELDVQWGWDLVQNHAVLSTRRLDYDVNNARDVWLYGLDMDRTRYVTATRFWRVSASVSRGDATLATESFWLGRLGLGVYQALPAGLAVWVEPSIELRDYDKPGALSVKPRRDREWTLAARLIKRDWRYRGFSPYVGVERSRNASNVELNDYSRTRIEFGATRPF